MTKLLTFLCLFIVSIPVFSQMTEPQNWLNYESVLGVKNERRHYNYDVSVIKSNVSSSVFWPGEKPRLTIQIVNNLEELIDVPGKVDVIQYGTKGIANDIWKPEMFKIADIQSIPIHVKITAKGYNDLTISPDIPEINGGYVLVLDLGQYGRRMVTSLVRTFKPNSKPMQYPKQSLDDLGPEFLSRIGIQSIRMGVPYIPTEFRDYQAEMAKLDMQFKEYKRRNITIMVMIGEGSDLTPLGTPRSFLDEKGRFLKTKQDYAWLPKLDPDFQEFVKQLCVKYGWPNGPVTAVSLWNEPWEGISISGWQADMLRYREIYTAMASGVLQARKQGADVLVGGTDSNSNAWDKLFGDGSMKFLPIFDFLSIHYQGMDSPCLYPVWNNRKDYKGRVKIWDTESWVGNTDDRIGLVVATNRSAGYDRSMGIYGGYMITKGEGSQRIFSPEGIKEIDRIPQAWSPAAALGAVQYLVGDRDFKELLFKNGLPWVMVFDGYDNNKDDGAVVISGDIGEAFGPENVLFRGVRGTEEMKEKAELRKKLQELSTNSPERKNIEEQLKEYKPLTGGKMIIAQNAAFRVYDFYGNLIPAKNGKFEIPLTYRGYFLRTDGSKGSFAKLTEAIKKSRIEGYEPVEIIASDMTNRIEQKPVLNLKITNILNRSIKGSLTVKLGNLKVSVPLAISLKGNETQIIPVRVLEGTSVANNTYPLEVNFDAGSDGFAYHSEDMHVNFISKLTINVDGKLDDWKDALPQTVRSSGKGSVSVTEAAWYPFKQFDKSADGFANGYLAYDKDYFYFAAKVADNTPHEGTYRFETRNDDEFFYPDTAYKLNDENSLVKKDGKREVNSSDTWALQVPDKNERIMNYWESSDNTNSFGVDLSLPVDKSTRVAFYLPNLDTWKAKIVVSNLATGEVLATNDCNKLWNGVYEVFDLAGNVRVSIQSLGWWYTVKLAGMFFDNTSNVTDGKASAYFVKEDLDTKGNWQGVYGNAGYYVFGLQPKFPAGVKAEASFVEDKITLVWPKDVRHYSYRKDPVIPDNSVGIGFATDNVQIAFNAIPEGKDGMEAYPKGTMPRYIGYKCSDYEYALNKVAPQYGGGTEIWRLLVPGMTRKHFYPRQPKSPFDGPVKDGKLAITHDGSTRITECAIPWKEIPDVKKALDEGKTVKFSFRVNDNGARSGCLELARDRSVSKHNSRAFHADWTEHWANELEFGFEK
jgi:hypothetical protein